MICIELSLIFIITRCITFTWAGHIQDKLYDAKAFKIVRFSKCPGTNLPYQLSVRVGKSNLQSISGNATVIAKENFPDKIKLTITINRCGSRENLDSCEEYYKMQNIDYCRSISPDILPGARNPFTIPFKPQLRCPIKKGIYRAQNYSFSLTPFMMFNLDGWYWKINTEMISSKETNRIIGCVILEGYTQL